MIKIKSLTIVIPIILLIASCGETKVLNVTTTNSEDTETSSSLTASQPFSYDNYATVLSTYVDDEGNVDYAALKENRQPLDAFNASLATLSPETFESWTESEKIAFWVNIYNSLTLQAIIEHYPTKSIRDIPGVWKRLQFNVMGKEMTLDEIEHQVLRVQFNEPRIHMGIVCASVGCPILRQEPFIGSKLGEQLDDQTRKFLALDRNFKIEKNDNQVYLSSIFKWFGEDFIKTYGSENKFAGNKQERSVLNFISQYLEPENQNYLANGGYQVKYLDYDWSLNEK